MVSDLKNQLFCKQYFNTDKKHRKDGIKHDMRFDRILSDSLSLRDVKSRSVAKIGLPLEVLLSPEGYKFDGYAFDADVQIKKGRDGKDRCPKYLSAWLYFGRDHLHIYTYEFSTLNNLVVEKTRDIAYGDVTDFEVYCESSQIYSKKLKRPSEHITKQFATFRIGGESLRLHAENNIDEAVKAIRGILCIRGNLLKKPQATLLQPPPER